MRSQSTTTTTTTATATNNSHIRFSKHSTTHCTKHKFTSQNTNSTFRYNRNKVCVCVCARLCVCVCVCVCVCATVCISVHASIFSHLVGGPHTSGIEVMASRTPSSWGSGSLMCRRGGRRTIKLIVCDHNAPRPPPPPPPRPPRPPPPPPPPAATFVFQNTRPHIAQNTNLPLKTQIRLPKHKSEICNTFG